MLNFSFDVLLSKLIVLKQMALRTWCTSCLGDWYIKIILTFLKGQGISPPPYTFSGSEATKSPTLLKQVVKMLISVGHMVNNLKSWARTNLISWANQKTKTFSGSDALFHIMMICHYCAKGYNCTKYPKRSMHIAKLINKINLLNIACPCFLLNI